MTDAWGRLHVEVLEDEIIITLPFTNYTVTYYKPASSPGFSQRTSRRRMIVAHQ